MWWNPFRLGKVLVRLFYLAKISDNDRLFWAYRGLCPHCGKELEWKKHSGKVLAPHTMACPDNHFAIEYHDAVRVTYHDKSGEPIPELFRPRLLRDDTPTRKIPRITESDIFIDAEDELE